MELDRCVDIKEHLPAFVTGDLDPNTTLRIQRHLGDACAPCAVKIEGLHAAFQRIPLAHVPVSLPEGSIDALVDRIGKQPQQERDVPIVFRDTNEGKLAWTLVLLAMAALISVGFWGRSTDRELRSAQSAARAAQVQTRRVVDEYRNLDEKLVQIAGELDALKASQSGAPPEGAAVPAVP
jgi:hypothetical protein